MALQIQHCFALPTTRTHFYHIVTNATSSLWTTLRNLRERRRSSLTGLQSIGRPHWSKDMGSLLTRAPWGGTHAPPRYRDKRGGRAIYNWNTRVDQYMRAKAGVPLTSKSWIRCLTQLSLRTGYYCIVNYCMLHKTTLSVRARRRFTEDTADKACDALRCSLLMKATRYKAPNTFSTAGRRPPSSPSPCC